MGEAKNRKDLERAIAAYDEERARYHEAADRLDRDIRGFERCVRMKWLCFGMAIGILVSTAAYVVLG